MRYLIVGLLFIVVGCVVLPNSITAPTNLTVVPGGISDTRPYFGKYKLFGTADELGLGGTFLLASCGCGDWQVLFKPDDGSAQQSLEAQFFSDGQYQPTGTVSVFGQSETNDRTFAGTVDQDGGLFTGKSQVGLALQDIAATRGNAHDQTVQACGLCHIGTDTIFPLPDSHPQYNTDPLNCIDCHPLGGP